MAEKSSRIRIQNISHVKPGLPHGKFLDLGGTNLPIPSGKSGYADKEKLSAEQQQMLDTWVEERDARVFDAVTGDLLNGPPASQIPPAAVSQVPASRAAEADEDDPFGDEEVDLTQAREADLPLNGAVPQPGQTAGAHMPDTQNVRQANVSTIGEDGRSGHDGLSPIPGMKPKSVDDSDKFTITAPRTTGPGAVVTTK